MFFSEYFQIDPSSLEDYGALNVSLLNDLPLFIDPFLLYTSKESDITALHNAILDYIVFLRKQAKHRLSPGLIKQWYHFPEVSQNWLGFSENGNKGRGLGKKFATAFKKNLPSVFRGFGSQVRGSHLEKISLFTTGIGRDMISDFTTNLIKRYLLNYTSVFAQQHIDPAMLGTFAVHKVRFDYKTESWLPGSFTLPRFGDDYVLLTPKSILTKDDTWISRHDLYAHLSDVIESIDNEQLRGRSTVTSLAFYRRDGIQRSPCLKKR